MRNQKGITLVALVITIIVMLILVAVSVSVALNGGLIDTAQEVKGWESKQSLETNGDFITYTTSDGEVSGLDAINAVVNGN